MIDLCPMELSTKIYRWEAAYIAKLQLLPPVLRGSNLISPSCQMGSLQLVKVVTSYIFVWSFLRYENNLSCQVATCFLTTSQTLYIQRPWFFAS